METIQITTNTGKKEMRAYLYWASFQSNIMSIIKVIGISAILALIMTFILKKSLIFFGIWTLIIIAAYTLIIIISNEQQVANIDKIKNFEVLNKTATFVFDDESFRVNGKKYGYKQIFRLFSIKNLFVINYNNEKSFLISKENITEEQIQTIVKAIKSKRS